MLPLTTILNWNWLAKQKYTLNSFKQQNSNVCFFSQLLAVHFLGKFDCLISNFAADLHRIRMNLTNIAWHNAHKNFEKWSSYLHFLCSVLTGKNL